MFWKSIAAADLLLPHGAASVTKFQISPFLEFQTSLKCGAFQYSTAPFLITKPLAFRPAINQSLPLYSTNAWESRGDQGAGKPFSCQVKSSGINEGPASYIISLFKKGLNKKKAIPMVISATKIDNKIFNRKDVTIDMRT